MGIDIPTAFVFMLPFVSIIIVLVIFARQAHACPPRPGPALPSGQPLMRLTDEFTIPLAPDRAYELLLDLENVAPLRAGRSSSTRPMPKVSTPVGSSVKLGPMRFSYEGTLRIVGARRGQPDAPSSRAPARPSGGAERATVRSVMEVLPEGDGSRVRMSTDLDITGRAAQMGAGIIGGVSRRMVRQAAECLAAARLLDRSRAEGRPERSRKRKERTRGTS